MEIEEPLLIQQTRGLDFGAGFYLTTREEQARSFANRIVSIRKSGIPTVNYYEFDDDTAKKSLHIKMFQKPNAEWLQFIRDNRLKIYEGIPYDIIIGPVANDRIFPTLQAFVIGQFTIEAALVAIKPYKLFDQYCFATEKALSMLNFIHSVTRLEGEEW